MVDCNVSPLPDHLPPSNLTQSSQTSSSPRFEPKAVFLWLTAICVALAICLDGTWFNPLWRVLLVMCASLFLGLFTVALIASPDAAEACYSDQPDAPVSEESGPEASIAGGSDRGDV